MVLPFVIQRIESEEKQIFLLSHRSDAIISWQLPKIEISKNGNPVFFPEIQEHVDEFWQKVSHSIGDYKNAKAGQQRHPKLVNNACR